MAKPKEKTVRQLRKIFALAKGKLDEEMIRDLAEGITGDRSLSKLSFDDANKIIKRLGGTVLHAVSKRTEQRRRQKAGVVHIVTHAQLDEMERRAKLRGMSDDGIDSLCRRTLGRNIGEDPRPRTTAECNKIIEALKAMEARDANRRPHFTIGTGGHAA